LFKGQKKAKLYLRYCHSFVTKEDFKLQEKQNKFFQNYGMINSCLALCGRWRRSVLCKLSARQFGSRGGDLGNSSKNLRK